MSSYPLFPYRILGRGALFRYRATYVNNSLVLGYIYKNNQKLVLYYTPKLRTGTRK